MLTYAELQLDMSWHTAQKMRKHLETLRDSRGGGAGNNAGRGSAGGAEEGEVEKYLALLQETEDELHQVAAEYNLVVGKERYADMTNASGVPMPPDSRYDSFDEIDSSGGAATELQQSSATAAATQLQQGRARATVHVSSPLQVSRNDVAGENLTWSELSAVVRCSLLTYAGVC